MAQNVFPNWKLGVKSRNLQSKLELEVVLAAILDSEGAKSCKSAFIRRQKAITANASETAYLAFHFQS